MRRVLGLDGCPAGWVGVLLEDGKVDRVLIAPGAQEVIEALAPTHVGIDMPIGFVDAPRETDAAARARLPGRASSVFSTAPRSVIAGWRAGSLTTHAQASAQCRSTIGVGLSQQAWRLVPKMAEVDDLAAEGRPIHEVHPELAFATVAGAPLPRKRSWPGMMLRIDLLRRLGIELPTRFDRDSAAAPDDVVDAAICAWVADGLAGAPGAIEQLPASTTQSAHGRPIVITVRHPAWADRTSPSKVRGSSRD